MSVANDTGRSAARGVPLRIMVIEDNRDLAKLFCDLLEVMGCTTRVAFNGRSALSMVEDEAPDLVFCDLRLPGETSGYDVASVLHADPRFSHIPLVAVTGYDGPDEHRRALEAGFVRVFEKPVKFAQMMEVLHHCGGGRCAG
ncbi:MAG TPA: response regulator [Noviherbaspirillum sp.]|jgi:CheY-like chemotaxis protein|uniref:response regulator n=1 Tax=Noviherbaspirillum sp. TaxID=1926288 RepID=UPI002F92C5D9